MGMIAEKLFFPSNTPDHDVRTEFAMSPSELPVQKKKSSVPWLGNGSRYAHTASTHPTRRDFRRNSLMTLKHDSWVIKFQLIVDQKQLGTLHGADPGFWSGGAQTWKQEVFCENREPVEFRQHKLHSPIMGTFPENWVKGSPGTVTPLVSATQATSISKLIGK